MSIVVNDIDDTGGLNEQEMSVGFISVFYKIPIIDN